MMMGEKQISHILVFHAFLALCRFRSPPFPPGANRLGQRSYLVPDVIICEKVLKSSEKSTISENAFLHHILVHKYT